MQVSYSLSSKDLERMQLIGLRNIRRENGVFYTAFLLRILFCFCIGLALATYFRVLYDGGTFSSASNVVIWILLFGAVAAMFTPYSWRKYLHKHSVSPTGSFLAKQTLRITPEGLAIESRYGQSKMDWNCFMFRARDEMNHYLFVDNLEAVIVPRSALQGIETDFLRMASGIQTDA